MPIVATCPQCQSTYQTPDALSGKKVRCKNCSTVFTVQPPVDPDAPPDLSQLDAGMDESMSGTTAGTIHSVSHHSYQPGADAGEGESYGRSTPVGASSRLTYPGAAQVDQFLPPALLLLSPLAVAGSHLSAAPSTGVGLSRWAVGLVAFLALGWPVAHAGLKSGLKKASVGLPAGSLVRSLATFMPTYLLGSLFWIMGGGSLVGLLVGLLVGSLVSVGVACLLFRVLPDRLASLGAMTAPGAVVGTALSAGSVLLLNVVGQGVLSKSASVSPFGPGLPWTAPAAAVVENKPAASRAAVPDAITSQANAGNAAPIDDTKPTMPARLMPTNLSTEHKLYGLVESIHRTPAESRYDRFVIDSRSPDLVAIQRERDGRRIELWDMKTWNRVGTTKAFAHSGSDVLATPGGSMVLRSMRNPTDSIEVMSVTQTQNDRVIPFPQGNAAVVTFVGMIDDDQVLVASTVPTAPTKLSTVHLATGVSTPFDLGAGEFTAAPGHQLMRLIGNGRIVVMLIQHRASGQLQLVTRPLDSTDPPEVRRIATEYGRVSPRGIATTDDGTVTAVVHEANGELQLSVWQTLPANRNGMVILPRKQAIVELNLGLRSQFETGARLNDDLSALTWIDDRTLLLMGNTLIDARSGAVIGKLGMDDARGAIRLADHRLLVEAGIGDGPTKDPQLMYVTLSADKLAALKR
jgi:predicted Zn finger-like uncharacterized protein